MVITEADFAAKARVLAVSVATQALEVLCLNYLAAGLMFELVILAQKLGKQPSTPMAERKCSETVMSGIFPHKQQSWPAPVSPAP